MITIYHNPRCAKSREALNYLSDKNLEFNVVEYLKKEITVSEMQSVLEKLGIKAEDLLRKNESIFKEKYKGKNLDEISWIQAMIENPKLIERPIVISGDKAVVARPVSLIENIL